MQAPLNATGTVTHEGVTSSSNTMTSDEMRSSLGIAPAEAEVPDTLDEAPPADAVAEPQPEPAEPAAKPAQPAPEAKKAKKDPQARIDEVVRQREETKRAAAAREAEYQREVREMRAEFQREIAALKQPAKAQPAQTEPGTDDPEPDVADTSKYPDGQFDRKYLKDQARWEARQVFRAEQQAAEQRYRQETQQRQQFEREQREADRLGKFRSHMDRVFTEQPDLQAQLLQANLTKPMWQAVMQSPIPEQVLSHLVNTPEELDRLIAMEPLHAIREINRIEYQLEHAAAVTGSAPAKPKTSAHAPISPVSGSHSAPTSGEPGLDAPYEEWAAYQNKLERESRVRK